MSGSLFESLLGRRMPPMDAPEKAVGSAKPAASTSLFSSLLGRRMPPMDGTPTKGKSTPPDMAPLSYKATTWDASEAAASQKTGVPVDVLRAIRLHGERSNGNQVSPKGARGVYQFIPSTRDAFVKKYGVDAYSADPDEQALATALHLKESHKRTGDWVKAMAGFNGGISGERGTNRTKENRDYVDRTSRAIATPLKISAANEYDQAWANDSFAINTDDQQDTDLA